MDAPLVICMEEEQRAESFCDLCGPGADIFIKDFVSRKCLVAKMCLNR